MATDAADRVRVDIGPALALPYKVGALTDVTVSSGNLGVNATEPMVAMTTVAWGSGGATYGYPDTGECTVNLSTHTFYPIIPPDALEDYSVVTKSTLGRSPGQ